MTAQCRPNSGAVRPRDAASLVLLRQNGGAVEVLMGRRHARHAFIPDAFVFPGGKLDRDDWRVRTMHSGAGTARTRALEAAAIRETYEETGLLLARAGTPGPATTATTWHAFTARGLIPDATALRLLARAITPAQSPIRFHARFFTALNPPLAGTLQGSGELLDLAWYPLDTARTLPVIDVTEFVLAEISTRVAAGGLTGPVAFWRYRSGKPLLSYEPHI